MLHVFFVFSHTTFYMAKSIQKHENIPETDVLYITARSYSNKYHKFDNLVLDKEYKALYKLDYNNFFKGWKYIKTVNKKLNKKINQPFILYTPNFRSPITQIIATHKLCRQFNFLEEGTLSYLNANYISPQSIFTNYIRKIIVGFLNYSRLYGLGRYYKLSHFQFNFFRKRNNPVFYTQNKKGFNYIKEYTIKIIPFYKDLKIKDENIDTPILLFDGWVNQIKEYHLYEKALSELISKEDINFLNLKFHPEQENKEKEFIIKYLMNKDISFRIIDDDIPMEQVFNINKELTVIGFVTSLLMYADMLGHRVISLKRFYSFAKKFKRTQSSRGRKSNYIKSNKWIEL